MGATEKKQSSLFHATQRNAITRNLFYSGFIAYVNLDGNLRGNLAKQIKP